MLRTKSGNIKSIKMKTYQNRITLKSVQTGAQSAWKRRLITVLLVYSLAVLLYGCGKPGNNPRPTPVNTTGCTITSDIEQALGLRLFEYDDKNLLTKMTGPNYYYGPFVRTITPGKVVDAYPSEAVGSNGNHYKGTIKTTYTYSGGSGNIYDGNPELLHELFSASNPPSTIKKDSLFQFKYQDAKKHLTSVSMIGNGTRDNDGFTQYGAELHFTYDDKDNLTQVKIVYDYAQKVTENGISHTYVKQVSDELLNITYDNKPSPYAAISKYWKFIGEDFAGFGAYNLNKLRFWAGRCAILSKNNPIKITGRLKEDLGLAPKDIDAKLTYEYNSKNLPVSVAMNGNGINAFTYSCK
jgi:hypothetical protein